MDAPRYLVLACALLGMAASGPAIRFAAAAPLAIVVWRVVLAWPVLAGIALQQKGPWPLARGAAAGVFLAAHWVLWVTAVQHTTLSTAALLVGTGALWAALLSQPLLGEAVTRRQWLGLGLGLFGLAAVIFAAPGRAPREGVIHSLLGDLLALGSAFAWVGYTFVGRRARQGAGFWSYTAAVYLVTGMVTSVFAVALRQPLWGFGGHTWLALAVLAAVPTLIGHGGLNYLLRFIGPMRLSLWTLSEPVAATLLGWAIFDEMPSIQMLLGGALVLLGVALGVGGTVPNKSAPARTLPG